jgi:hypothetical protein
MKKPGTAGSRASIFQRSLGFFVFTRTAGPLPRDLRGPDTTTRARTTGSGGHGIQILPLPGAITKLKTPRPPFRVPPAARPPSFPMAHQGSASQQGRAPPDHAGRCTARTMAHELSTAVTLRSGPVGHLFAPLGCAERRDRFADPALRVNRFVTVLEVAPCRSAGCLRTSQESHRSRNSWTNAAASASTSCTRARLRSRDRRSVPTPCFRCATTSRP